MNLVLDFTKINNVARFVRREFVPSRGVESYQARKYYSNPLNTSNPRKFLFDILRDLHRTFVTDVTEISCCFLTQRDVKSDEKRRCSLFKHIFCAFSWLQPITSRYEMRHIPLAYIRVICAAFAFSLYFSAFQHVCVLLRDVALWHRLTSRFL